MLTRLWNENVILIIFPSLAAPEVVILTNSSAAIDGNFVKMATFSFTLVKSVAQKML